MAIQCFATIYPVVFRSLYRLFALSSCDVLTQTRQCTGIRTVTIANLGASSSSAKCKYWISSTWVMSVMILNLLPSSLCNGLFLYRPPRVYHLPWPYDAVLMRPSIVTKQEWSQSFHYPADPFINVSALEGCQDTWTCPSPSCTQTRMTKPILTVLPFSYPPDV